MTSPYQGLPDGLEGLRIVQISAMPTWEAS